MLHYQRTGSLSSGLLAAALAASLLLPVAAGAERSAVANSQPQLHSDFSASHATRGPVRMSYEVRGVPAVGELVPVILRFESRADSQFTITLRVRGELTLHGAAEHQLHTVLGEPAVVQLEVTPESGGAHYLVVDLQGESAGNRVADSYLVKLRVPNGDGEAAEPPEAIYLPAR